MTSSSIHGEVLDGAVELLAGFAGMTVTWANSALMRCGARDPPAGAAAEPLLRQSKRVAANRDCQLPLARIDAAFTHSGTPFVRHGPRHVSIPPSAAAPRPCVSGEGESGSLAEPGGEFLDQAVSRASPPTSFFAPSPPLTTRSVGIERIGTWSPSGVLVDVQLRDAGLPSYSVASPRGSVPRRQGPHQGAQKSR